MRTRRLGFALRLIGATAALVASMALPAAAQTTIEYYALDAVGSVRVVFDQTGSVIARRDYEPFGGEVAATGTAPNRLFAGLFRDAEAGLDYAEARSYQVRTGRFNGPDPIYAGLFEPQRWNRYAYALNSPATFIDPSGLCALPDGGACPRFTDSTTVTGTMTYPEIFTRPWGGGGMSDDFVPDLGSFDQLINEAAFMGSTFVPGVGEILDAGVILDPKSSPGEVLAAGVSLFLNKLTGGLLPNYGALRFPSARGTVLGHYPAYIDTAQSIGARYFNVPPQVWGRMTPAEQWAANTKFLDRLVLRGDTVILSTPVSQARAGSWFARELEYLSSRGYTLSTDATRMLPPGRR